MRALPIGWVLPHDQAERRRQVTIAMSQATHADPVALVAACVVAACASWALENASPSMFLEAAAGEAREAAQEVGTDARLAEMLTQVSAETWELAANGVSLDPYETVAAVLWCATRATSLRSGLVNAVQLGGDTDTVAALVGGLMGAKLTAEQVRAELPWHQLVALPEPESEIADIAVALAATRAIQSM
jgi:ADP-ribosylglycohydrolase